MVANDAPDILKKSVGADSIASVSATGDLDKLARMLADKMEGVTESRRQDGVVQVHFKGARGILPRIVNIAESSGYQITDLSVSEPTLENVFIKLTGRELRE